MRGRLLLWHALGETTGADAVLQEECPMSILRQSPEFAKSAEAISVSTLSEVIAPEMIAQAIERSHSHGKRRRKLPAELMAVAIVVLGLFAGATWRYAVLKTLQGLRLRSDFTTDEPAGKGAICKARYRYGRDVTTRGTCSCRSRAQPSASRTSPSSPPGSPEGRPARGLPRRGRGCSGRSPSRCRS